MAALNCYLGTLVRVVVAGAAPLNDVNSFELLSRASLLSNFSLAVN